MFPLCLVLFNSSGTQRYQRLVTHLAGVISSFAVHVPQEGGSFVSFTLLEHSACGWVMVLAFGDILGGTAGMSWVLAASWVALLGVLVLAAAYLALGSGHSLHSCFSVSDSSPLGDRGGCCLAGAPQSL